MKSVKRCAYLTMAEPGDFVTDYDLSFDAMAALGWRAEPVVWNDPAIDWDAFDAVYICTPWDYPQRVEEFLNVLETIDRSAAVLINPLPLVHWNLEKNYLRDIEARGGAVVPSLWCERFEATEIRGWFAAHGTERIVVKPAVGANAADTFVLEEPVPPELIRVLAETFGQRRFFVQPFMPNVIAEGEYSLIWFGGECSHAILKTPKAGDFRSQEEHGAEIRAVRPLPALLAAARGIFECVEPKPAYGRADLVRGEGDRFLLMELELIEPSLYLRTDAGASARFAAAIDQWFQVLSGK
jgi:glutathione synthase/RimK-type ligase-like ATP-grasp enzyme